MAVAEELQVIIDAKVKDAVRDMKKVDKSLGQAEQSTKKMSASMSKALRTIGGFAAAAVSIGAITKAVKASVAAFRTQEEAEAQLRGALLATGQAAGGTAEELHALASELQGVTTFGDEATIQATGLLQSLANLDKDGLKQIIPRIQDFATGMGIDLTNAAQLVGKTLSSSTNALVRYGVEIDASASKSEKLDQLTAALDSKFGGLSQEMANTASGGLTQLNNAFGDLQEMMGERILESMGGIIGRLTDFVERTIETRQEINALNDALSDDGGEASLKEQVSTLEDMRDRARENLAAYEEQFGSLDDLNDIQKAVVADSQRQLETANSQLAIKRQLLDLERRAADGQAALAEHEQRRQERLEAFNAAGEYANELAEARKDPLEREIEALDAQINSLAEKRDIMRETGTWDQQYQQIINDLVAERVRMQTELNEKLNEQEESQGRLLDAEKIRQETTATFQEESKARLDEIEQKLRAQEDQAESTAQTIADMYSGNVLPVFEEFGRAIVMQEDAWRGLGQVAIEAVAGVLRALAQQAMAQAAAALAQGLLGDPRGFAAAAQWGVAAGLAQTGAGIVSGIASKVGSAATGADFETSGPQLLMVGDNPGGRERVTVEPTSSSIGSGEPMHITVNIDGKPIIDTVQRASRSRNLLIDARAVV